MPMPRCTSTPPTPIEGQLDGWWTMPRRAVRGEIEPLRDGVGYGPLVMSKPRVLPAGFPV
jgi:hypothetical protein